MDEVEFYLKDLASRFKAIDKQKYYLSYQNNKENLQLNILKKAMTY